MVNNIKCNGQLHSTDSIHTSVFLTIDVVVMTTTKPFDGITNDDNNTKVAMRGWSPNPRFPCLYPNFPLRTKVYPNLPENSVLVIDKASYHNRLTGM